MEDTHDIETERRDVREVIARLVGSEPDRAKLVAKLKSLWESKGKGLVSGVAVRGAGALQKGRGAWRRAVTGDTDTRVRDHIRASMHRPHVVRLIDKVSFVSGMAVMLLTQAVVLKMPAAFGLWFALVIPVLCLARYFIYSRIGFKAFLYDFCYLVQALSLVTVFVSRATAPSLHAAVFVLANGPLLWAVPTWRNSMVLHSLDKVTSVAIHVLPALLSLASHWYEPIPPGVSYIDAFTTQWDVYNVMPSSSYESLTFAQGFVWPMALYVLWQIAYYWKTEVRDRAIYDADPTLTTSLRWLATHPDNPAHKFALKAYRSVGVMAPDEVFDHTTLKTKILFMASQFLYQVITILPAQLLYRSALLHIAFLCAIIGISMWNGACYYFDTFARSYEAKLAKRTDPPAPVSADADLPAAVPVSAPGPTPAAQGTKDE